MAKRKPPKPCRRCGETAMNGIAYCKACKRDVLAELMEARYLETGGYGHKGQNRTSEMKEKTYETKHGTWNQ